MRFDVNNWGSEPPCDVLDHWLDDALRAVPLPDGLLERLHRLAGAPSDRAGENDYVDRGAGSRGFAGGSRGSDTSVRRS